MIAKIAKMRFQVQFEGRTHWYTRNELVLSTLASTSSTRPHSGQWRDQKETRFHCATSNRERHKGGPLCQHKGGIIVLNHWSCCGSVSKDSECLMTKSEAVTQRHALVVGCKVKLSPDFSSHSDAAHGPMNPGDIGTLIAIVKRAKPYHVEFNGRKWWYSKSALCADGFEVGASAVRLSAVHWTCQVCTFENTDMASQTCSVCNSPRNSSSV